MAVHSDIEHHNEPKVYIGPETGNFSKNVLDLNPSKLVLQYEAYIVGEVASKPLHI